MGNAVPFDKYAYNYYCELQSIREILSICNEAERYCDLIELFSDNANHHRLHTINRTLYAFPINDKISAM